MPALANPRHEAFAQAIFQGLSQDPQPGLRTGASRETFSNGKAYKRAGYLPSNTNAADAAASRLLRKVKPILERVRELQAEANKRLQTYHESASGAVSTSRPNWQKTKEMPKPSSLLNSVSLSLPPLHRRRQASRRLRQCQFYARHWSEAFAVRRLPRAR